MTWYQEDLVLDTLPYLFAVEHYLQQTGEASEFIQKTTLKLSNLQTASSSIHKKLRLKLNLIENMEN